MAQLNTIDTLEPRSMSQALKDSRWRQAMFDDYDALVHHDT